MSRKRSSIYDSSSFDSVEGTRRLSEEMASTTHSDTSLKRNSKDGVDRLGELNEMGTRSDDVINENGTTDREGSLTDVDRSEQSEQVLRSSAVITNNDDNNNSYEKHAGNSHRQSLGDITVSSDDVGNIEISTARHRNSSDNTSSSNARHSSIPRHSYTDVSEEGKGNVSGGDPQFDQRSESDSDLDSPDDFDDGGCPSDNGADGSNEKDTTSSRRESQESQLYSNRRPLLNGSSIPGENATENSNSTANGVGSYNNTNTNNSRSSKSSSEPSEMNQPNALTTSSTDRLLKKTTPSEDNNNIISNNNNDDNDGKKTNSESGDNVVPTSAIEMTNNNTTNNNNTTTNNDNTNNNNTNNNNTNNNNTNNNTMAERVEYAQLTQAEIDDKLRDGDVVRQGEMLDTVREVGVTNLNKLQQMNWNDPALRRLFMKPRINKTEVSSVKVDPDIKNTVNEFLRMNVTENFVISRVLRENYATFFSWLTSHLQTERNAWTARLAQALEQADQERKSSLQCRKLVVEAAARLRMLVKTSSNLLFGIPDKDDEMFFKVDAMRRGGGKREESEMMHRRGGGGGMRESSEMVKDFPGRRGKRIPQILPIDTSGYTSEGNSGSFRRGGRFGGHGIKASPRKTKELVSSNFRMVKVSDNKHENVNYDSDPGEVTKDWRLVGGDVGFDESENEMASSKMKGQSIKVNDKKKTGFGKSSNISIDGENDDVPPGYDLDGYIIEDDKFTDWNQALVDNIGVLTDLCDTLLMDRKSCLQLMKVNPNRCASLVDGVSKFVKNKYNEVNSKRDIEKRFRILENENRNLQEEMSILHKTLADKNRDALSLQTQFDRLESLMTSYSVPKLNKCVGTSEEMFPAVFKNNLTVGGNKTPRQNIAKLSKSPKLSEKESKTKTVELPSVNGTSNIKQLRQKREFHSPNLSGLAKDQEQQSSQDAPEQSVSSNGTELSPPKQTSLVREPSLIEISEEKLKTLKHRAKKLEDSLHEAISSMERLNKSTQQSLGSSSNNNNISLSSLGPLYSKNKVNGEKNGAKTFKRWQKASFEVNNRPLDSKSSSEVASTPRVALVKRPDAYLNWTKEQNAANKNKDQAQAPDIQVSLAAESSSLLEGRSIWSAPRDGGYDPAPVSSSLRMSSERVHQGLTSHSSRSHCQDDLHYQSDDGRSRHLDSDAVHSYRRQPDRAAVAVAATHVVASSPQQSRRLRATHNASRILAGRQTVSKCLRCQKLFSPTDNHKLACCYHTKAKERLEHYDQSGMLIRVMYAWKCCHEPQESEGCCYGQHV